MSRFLRYSKTKEPPRLDVFVSHNSPGHYAQLVNILNKHDLTVGCSDQASVRDARLLLCFLSDPLSTQHKPLLQDIEKAHRLKREIVIVYSFRLEPEATKQQLAENVQGGLSGVRWIRYFTREPLRSKTIRQIVKACAKSKQIKQESVFNEDKLVQNLQKEVLPGTRRWLFSAVDAWIEEPSWSRVFVLTSKMGMGKSAFCAGLVAKEDTPVLGYHFFSHIIPSSLSAEVCIMSLSRQLESMLPGFGKALQLKKNGKQPKKHTLISLFKQYVLSPLSSKYVHNNGRKILLLDGLDACQDVELVQFLQNEWEANSPNWLGVLVSTRNAQGFSQANQHPIEPQSEENLSDIRQFFLKEWKVLLSSNEHATAVEMLLKKSEGVFLFAQELCKTLLDPNTSPQSGEVDFKPFTASNLKAFPASLAPIYEAEFQRFRESAGQKDYETVLSLVLAARAPLPIEVWESCVEEGIRVALKEKMWPLFNVGEHIFMLHNSMQQYLLEESPSGVDVGKGHSVLARYCMDNQTTSPFALQHVFYHLCLDEQMTTARELVTDFQWLLRRVSLSVDIVKDLKTVYLEKQDDKEVSQIASAIRLANHILRSEPEQLASQLLARIQPPNVILSKAAEFSPGVPWWRPTKPTLENADSALIQVISGHDKPIDALAVSPLCDLLASGGRDGQVIIWSVSSGEKEHKCVRPVKPGGVDVNTVAFSPDGTRLASGYDDGRVNIWSTLTGESIHELSYHSSRVWSVCYSPNGSRLISASDDLSIVLWDTINHNVVKILGPFPVAPNTVSFSHDGGTIAAGFDDAKIQSWEADVALNTRSTDELDHLAKKYKDTNGHQNRIRCIKFAPTGDPFLVSCSDDFKVILWNTDTQELLHRFNQHRNRVYGVDFSPDGLLIASASADRTVKVWQTATGKIVHSFTGHADPTMKVAFVTNTTLASASLDKTIRLWKLDNPVPAHGHGEGHSKWVVSVAVAKDGSRIVTGSQDKTVCVWDGKTGKLIHALGKNGNGHKETVWHVIIHPSRPLAGSGSPDKTFRLWNIDSGQPLQVLKGHRGSVSGIAFAHNKDYCASGSMDQTAKLWKISTGECVHSFEGHNSTIAPVCFSADDRFFLTGSSDHTAKMWDVESGAILYTLDDHDFLIRAVSLSMDATIAVTGCDDGKAFVWNVATETKLHKLEGHLDCQLRSAVVTRDGQHVVTTDRLNNIIVWSVETGERVDNADATKLDIPFPSYETDGMQGLPLHGTGLLTQTPDKDRGIGFSVDIGTLNTRKLTDSTGTCGAIAEGDKIHIVSLMSPW